MEQSNNTPPATDAGTPDTGLLLQPADFRPDDLPVVLRVSKRYVAVCDNGDLVPLTIEQFRDNWLERGPSLTTQLGRDDIAFLCSEQCAQRWSTGEDVVKHVAKHRIAQREREEFDSASAEQSEPLFLEGAFQLVAQVAREDERGRLCDLATEAAQINRFRAAFAQARGQLLELESDFEAHVSDEVARLHQELSCITNRGRN